MNTNTTTWRQPHFRRLITLFILVVKNGGASNEQEVIRGEKRGNFAFAHIHHICTRVHVRTAWGRVGNCLCLALDKLISFNYRLSS